MKGFIKRWFEVAYELRAYHRSLSRTMIDETPPDQLPDRHVERRLFELERRVQKVQNWPGGKKKMPQNSPVPHSLDELHEHRSLNDSHASPAAQSESDEQFVVGEVRHIAFTQVYPDRQSEFSTHSTQVF